MWDSEFESIPSRNNRNAFLTNNHCVQSGKFEQEGQAWYVVTDIPSDLIIQIGEISFHLHKFPLLSKSGKMNRIIYESRESDLKKVILDDLPGGADAFELAAKFCYGIDIDLKPTTISGVRCAAEYLEMTEDLEEGNMIFKTEAFFSYVVLCSWKDSILALKSCESLSPWAENLQIVRRCCESVAWKACSDSTELRWKCNGKQRESSPNRSQVLPDWWCEDLSVLRIDHFVRVITAIKVKGIRYELVGSAIARYAMKSLPGMMTEGSSGSVEDHYSAGNWSGGLHMIIQVNKGDHCSSPQRTRQKTIIESLISIIPPQNDSVSCSFLLRLLRIANMVNVAPALVTELEKRVGMQLQHATLVDLLIPSYDKSETIYDVDLVQRILEYFLIHEDMDITSPSSESQALRESNEGTRQNVKTIVARLVDSYLAEVARDKNLSVTKFQVLAEALPESARSCDDGIYRAIDSYLKAHSMLSEHQRRRLCRVMDCQKLSMDACTHAAQNERLPLRVVVQVILSEQIKLNNSLANASLKEAGNQHHQQIIPNKKTLLEETPQSFPDGWETAKKDINTLKFDLESVKTKYLELQHDMEGLQRQNEKETKMKHRSAWSSGWKKLSKMTKITTIENTGMRTQSSTQTTVTTPRRWRNSVS